MAMDDDLKVRILGFLEDHQTKFRAAIFWVKLLLVSGGALLAGWASFFSGGEVIVLDPSKWSGQQIFGVIGVLLVFLGAWFLLKTEEKPGAAYDAHRALMRADELSSELDEAVQLLESYRVAAIGTTSLYVAYNGARGVLEQAALARVSDEVKLIRDCLWSMKQDLQISLLFESTHTWTICVYKCEFNDDDQHNYLRCVAHERSIPCDLGDARLWKEGVGVGGMALAKDGEVVAPDILSHGAGTIFRLEGDIVRRADLVRYRSMMAVPVSVDGDSKPWGVVLASCDQPEHFGAQGGMREHMGLQPEEAVRTLAAVAALAIAICRSNTILLKDNLDAR